VDRLLEMLREAAAGRPPAPDGRVDVLPAPAGAVNAVVGFPFHNVVAGDVDEDAVRSRIDPGDPGAALKAPFLIWLAGWLGSSPGSVDAVLVRTNDAGLDEPLDLHLRDELIDHPRVQRAARYRTDLRVFTETTGDGVLVLGRGLAGRWELSFEVDAGARGRGLGRRLAAAAPQLVPTGEPVFAQVAPANTASLRAVLAAGYRPIGAEVLFRRTTPR
jgi:GNAT superfamily N-acetyltransferase